MSKITKYFHISKIYLWRANKKSKLKTKCKNMTNENLEKMNIIIEKEIAIY